MVHSDPLKKEQLSGARKVFLSYFQSVPCGGMLQLNRRSGINRVANPLLYTEPVFLSMLWFESKSLQKPQDQNRLRRRFAQVARGRGSRGGRLCDHDGD